MPRKTETQTKIETKCPVNPVPAMLAQYTMLSGGVTQPPKGGSDSGIAVVAALLVLDRVYKGDMPPTGPAALVDWLISAAAGTTTEKLFRREFRR